MPSLSLKPIHELTEEDFVRHSVWVAYYEPDELDDLERLGIDKEKARSELASLDNPDHFAFPVPGEAAKMPFNYLYVRADIWTAGGTKLVGYVTDPCVAAFRNGERYQFNRGSKDMSTTAANGLAAILGEKSIFPLRIEIPATGRKSIFDLE